MASPTSPQQLPKARSHPRRIRTHPRCRARRPRRAAQQRLDFQKRSANSQPFPHREGACPFRQGLSRFPPTLGESASVQRIRPGVPCRTVCCAERASPFPTMRRLRIRRGFVGNRELLRGAPGSARPTGMRLRICRTSCENRGIAARNAEDGVPYRGCANSPEVWRKPECCCRGVGTPPPTGRRVQIRRDRRALQKRTPIPAGSFDSLNRTRPPGPPGAGRAAGPGRAAPGRAFHSRGAGRCARRR